MIMSTFLIKKLIFNDLTSTINKKVFYMNVKELKSYIKKHKIKYQTISEKSGIPLGTIRNIFSNSNIDPRYSTIEKIENALDIKDDGFAKEYFSMEEENIIKDYRVLSEKDKKLFIEILRDMVYFTKQ